LEVHKGGDPVALRWYVVHTYSGYENKVKAALEEKVRGLGLEDKITDVLIPSDSVVELVKGERRTSNRKFFPGYILVHMELDDQTWHVVKNTPKVTGFIGSRTEPAVIPDEDVDKIMSQMAEGQEKPKPKYSFEAGDSVRVVDGPFINFNGTVEEVRPDKGKLRVLVSIFGRPTPVELDFIQVTKN
jgi:transcriptional antiterminator NusG